MDGDNKMKLEIPDELFNEEELSNTPDRFKRFIEELKQKRNDFKFTMFDNPGYKGMIVMKYIAMSSLCAHHLLPFTGVAHIGYIPKDKLCGASKLIRALEKFSSKPQTQEKLTLELIEFLVDKLKPKGVGVVIEAAHDCMRIRGVKNPSSVMITSELRGVFDKNPATRDEFMRFIGK